MKALRVILILMLACLMLAGCGKEEAVETAPPTTLDYSGMELGLTQWHMDATTWSSPNGATVNLTATPTYHTATQCAELMVILNQEEVFRAPCAWDGTSYTCEADLNAADGYGYYVVLTDIDGTEILIAVNTVESVYDATLINMETALNSYGTFTVEESKSKGTQLTIQKANAEIQLTTITQATPVTIEEAFLVLTCDGSEVSRKVLDVPANSTDGKYQLPVKNVQMDAKGLEDDQRLTLQLEILSSDGQTLTVPGGTWYYSAGELFWAVG